MSSAKTNTSWECIGASLTGASHTGSNTPRQDSIKCWPEGLRSSTSLVAAVGDGHGNSLHSRSLIGSRVAVDCGITELQRLMKSMRKMQVSDSVFSELASQSGKNISDKWNERVLQHLKCEPLPRGVTESLTPDQQDIIKNTPNVSYGTTLLSVGIDCTKDEARAVLQRIGDGVIACINRSGEVKLPFGEADKNSQHTDSLCSDNAAEKIQYRLLRFSDVEPPACFVLSTDGYVDAVGGIERFTERLGALWKVLQKQGIPQFQITLKVHLESSRDKLFDDTTMAFIVQHDCLERSEGRCHA